ncbi:MAG TPA: hypothetical protein VGH51_02295 [Candidatus Angelobacter sp.]
MMQSSLPVSTCSSLGKTVKVHWTANKNDHAQRLFTRFALDRPAL